MQRQMRQTRAAAGTFRTREAEGQLYVEGYFAVFGALYEMWPGATETILSGAFREALNDDIRALVDHDTRLVLGRTKAGTLELKEDEKGLFGRIRINQQDADAMNLYHRVQREDVDQCSFGFDILDEEMVEGPGAGVVQWRIKKVKLYEVSVVTFPAYEQTSVQARKKDYQQARERKLEQWRIGMKTKLKGETEWH